MRASWSVLEQDAELVAVQARDRITRRNASVTISPISCSSSPAAQPKR
jgi:hypothetical protein